jgi:acyl carrier protein
MPHSAALRRFLTQEFLPDAAEDEIPADFDLIENGVIDSLGLLKIIAWVEEQLGIQIEIEEMVPENFTSIAAIDALLARSAASAQSGRSQGSRQ